ncbi:hypothetical protein ABEB36_007285 [Hypothenemus hampei]|uniref:Uncharacterized protein n=1 Tax=Hypothenemus hampei TaxID=57062 RepID=A0ABD1ETF3_HYPHA
MERELCRTCGKNGENFINIFNTEGLRTKIETCLPINVSQHCLLPDTLCTECYLSIENFYIFIKRCLQSIIILESQLNIQESCLRATRNNDQSANILLPKLQKCQEVQTDDYLDIMLSDRNEMPKSHFLVDYEIHSDSENCDENDFASGQVITEGNTQRFKAINQVIEDILSENPMFKSSLSNFNQYYFETVPKKPLKRKSDNIFEDNTKLDKTDASNKRKCSKPKKCEYMNLSNVKVKLEIEEGPKNDFDSNGVEEENSSMHCCFFCNVELPNSAALAEHCLMVHGNKVLKENKCKSSTHKRRNVPRLLKISDFKHNHSFEGTCDQQVPNEQLNITCPICIISFSTKPELFVHLQLAHSRIPIFLCGICMKQFHSQSSLTTHVMDCLKNRPMKNRYYCEVCGYDDNNFRTMESHILVHNFLWQICQKEIRNFDPEDYIKKNPDFVLINNSGSSIKNFSCLDCNRSDFDTFKKFSFHRRSVHSIFHCDLCNKFYGRSSHLWKHVNRLHKKHPSITCQICFKTSASKYHLAQHFAKIHRAKNPVLKKNFIQNRTDQDNMSSSQSESSYSEVNNESKKQSDVRILQANYSSPLNTQSEYKCRKCLKTFHRRLLLRKHKKNCRPRLQKDLLTRCTTCSRVFKDRQSLNKHLVNYHSDYECEICKEKVPSKCEIISHIRFKHPSSHLLCSVCENILRSKEDLLEHLLDHDNSFVCHFCGDTLSSKVKLKMHVLSLHRKILSLSCGICLKLFSTQHCLRTHVQKEHKDELKPPNTCPICGKSYGSRWKTFDHLNKSHGRFFKACNVCLEVFETQDELENHFSKLHPNHQINVNFSKNGKDNIKLDESTNFDCINNKKDMEQDNNSKSNENNVKEESKIELPIGEFSAQEMKMCLLEKRLLGKSVTQAVIDPDCYVGDLSMRSSLKENVSIKTVESLTNNGTKRTVYENSNDPSRCESCEKVFPAKKHLWQHYIRCHKGVAATVCGICLKTTENYNDLQRHLHQMHKSLLHGQGYGSNFICRVCGRYHNASSKLRLHMAIHKNFNWNLLDKDVNLDVKQENVEEDIYNNMIEQVDGFSGNDEETKLDFFNEVHKNQDFNNLLSFNNLLDALKSQNEVSTQYRSKSVIHRISQGSVNEESEESEELDNSVGQNSSISSEIKTEFCDYNETL